LHDYLIEKGHRYSLEDPDMVDGKTNVVPAWFLEYKKLIAEAGVSIPAMVIGTLGADEYVTNIVIKPLPNTAEEAIEEVKARGG